METLIESERERKGLSQAELGAVLDPPVPERTVCEWEKGVTPITATQLLNLTKLFRCSADYLLGLTDERTPMALETFCQDCTLDYLLESDSPAKPTI